MASRSFASVSSVSSSFVADVGEHLGVLAAQVVAQAVA